MNKIGTKKYDANKINRFNASLLKAVRTMGRLCLQQM